MEGSQGGARPARGRGGEDRLACGDAAGRAEASLLAPAAAAETSWWAETQPGLCSGGGDAGPACGGGEDGLASLRRPRAPGGVLDFSSYISLLDSSSYIFSTGFQ
jgi:hypothetical protein